MGTNHRDYERRFAEVTGDATSEPARAELPLDGQLV